LGTLGTTPTVPTFGNPNPGPALSATSERIFVSFAFLIYLRAGAQMHLRSVSYATPSQGTGESGGKRVIDNGKK
jgi:hypothetical protein